MFKTRDSSGACCSGLGNLLDGAGRRGLAVLVVERPAGLAFNLQSRGVAHEDVGLLEAIPTGPDININISSSTGLQYCPFCGFKLAKLLGRDRTRFAALAVLHARFDDHQSVSTSSK